MLLSKWNMHQSQNPISDGITWKHHRVKEYVSYLLEKGQKWGMREQNRKDKKTTLIGTHLAKKDIFYRWLQELQYSVGSWPYIYIAEEKQWRIYAYNSWWLLMWWLRTAQRYIYWINKQQESSKEILTSFGKELWYGLPSEMCRKIEREAPAKKTFRKIQILQKLFWSTLWSCICGNNGRKGTFTPDSNCRWKEIEKWFDIFKRWVILRSLTL